MTPHAANRATDFAGGAARSTAFSFGIVARIQASDRPIESADQERPGSCRFDVVLGGSPAANCNVRTTLSSDGRSTICSTVGNVSSPVPELAAARLTLRRWREDDRAPFAAMNADPVVMADLGGILDRGASDRKLDRFDNAFDNYGYGRWVVEGPLDGADSCFLGYTGIMPNRDDHPLGHHEDLGWRLRREAWGHGYASEAARAALHDAFDRVGLTEVVAYTALDNLRSQAVMARVGLRRDSSRDFDAHYDGFGTWHGLVWIGTRPSPSS